MACAEGSNLPLLPGRAASSSCLFCVYSSLNPAEVAQRLSCFYEWRQDRGLASSQQEGNKDKSWGDNLVQYFQLHFQMMNCSWNPCTGTSHTRPVLPTALMGHSSSNMIHGSPERQSATITSTSCVRALRRRLQQITVWTPLTGHN